MAGADLYIEGFFPEAVSFALGAKGAAAVAGQKNAVLYLIQVAFDFGEEFVDSLGMFVAFPEDLVLLFGQVDDGLVDGEIEFFCGFDELITPPDQFFSFPGGDGAFINAQAPVGYDEVGVDAQDLAETFTGGAGSV